MTATERAEQYYGPREVARFIGRRNDILARLQALSNGTTSNYRPRVSGSAHTSSPPPGVMWGANWGDGNAPPKDRSLFDHYLWRFAHEVGSNIDYGHQVCAEALADLNNARRQRVANEDPVDRDQRILNRYVGWSAVSVAYAERIDVKHIQRLRASNELDPRTGIDHSKPQHVGRWIDDLLRPGVQCGALELAKRFLEIVLDDGPRPAAFVFALAEEAHIKDHTLRRAKEAAGVRTYKTGHGWMWSLEATAHSSCA